MLEAKSKINEWIKIQEIKQNLKLKPYKKKRNRNERKTIFLQRHLFRDQRMLQNAADSEKNIPANHVACLIPFVVTIFRLFYPVKMISEFDCPQVFAMNNAFKYMEDVHDWDVCFPWREQRNT